jgi:hypothetical protein
VRKEDYVRLGVLSARCQQARGAIPRMSSAYQAMSDRHLPREETRRLAGEVFQVIVSFDGGLHNAIEWGAELHCPLQLSGLPQSKREKQDRQKLNTMALCNRFSNPGNCNDQNRKRDKPPAGMVPLKIAKRAKR